jgi:uncharacterized membrane protein (UPF0127 family)
MKIKIADKEYNVEVAETEDQKETGLQGRKELAEDEGMLFIYDEPDEIGFWMEDTYIPLDIIFINDEFEVIAVAKGEPESKEIHEEKDVKYVLELNQNSGVKVGDELDLLEDEEEVKSKMLVLDENGGTQMELDGGERIFSRKHTKILIKLANKAYKSELDKDYKALGKKVFKYIEEQDNREQEHVELKKD